MNKIRLWETVRKYVGEFFNSDDKKLISDPHKRIYLHGDIYVSRKSLKYVTNSRGHDDYGIGKIVRMIIRAGKVVDDPELRLPNHNKKYPSSEISTRLFHEDGALLVIHLRDEYGRRVFNAFYRSKDKYLRMLGKSDK